MAEPAKDQLDALKRAIAERRYDEAIRDARRLVLESDKHPETQLLLGEALLAAGRNDEARVEMLALVRERPEESAAHRLLGEAYLRDRQLDPARASLRRAVELDPDDEAARDLLLEADSEVAAPMSSTVERWMGAAEPATTEMTMPEYLEEAPAMTPSASLRALLERAEPKQPAALKIPKPAGVTAKMAPQPAPSTDSVSVELEVDQDASTGQRAQPQRPPRADETGEISIEELEAPAPAPRPRSVPPPPPRTGSTSPGAAAAPTGNMMPADALTNVARPRPPGRSSTLMGLPTPVGVPAPPSASPPAKPRSIPPAAPPPAGAKPRSIPPSAPPPAGAKPRSIPPSAPPPQGLAGPSPKPRIALAPRPAAPDVEDAPTRPALRSEEPLASPPTVITAPQAAAGALLSPISADNVAITAERGSMAKSGAPPSAAGTPGPWPPKAAIPTASPPPKLGSIGGVPSAAPTPPHAAPAYGAPSHAAAYGAPSPYAPMPGPLAPEPAGRPAIGQGAPHLGGRQAGAPEPITKPTLRAPGTRGEATQRIRLTQVTVALVLSGVVAIALLVAITRWLSARERDEALAIASDNGTEADVVRALAATEGAPASRARLFATATVELGEDRSEAAEALLASAAPGPETSVARSLLAISRGQATEALVMLEELQASGVTLAEGARARALALQAMGRFPEAQAAAGQAWGFRPAARHSCLLAHTAALAGDVAAADATVRSIVDADARPCARVVRAEIAFARNDLTTAETEATVVLGALAERATNADEAWAHHLRGRGAQLRGDVATARAEHRAAAEIAPRADETLLLRALEGLLAAGDAPAAQELSARLTPNPPNPVRRAELLVAIALERRDFAAADASLALLTPGARTALARGRILEARGSTQAALEQYAAATADPTLAVDASLRRARLLSRLGRDAEARGALEAGARTTPTDATLAAALAHAALATDDVRAARAAIEPALRAHADDVRLVALSALVRARDGDAVNALAAARTAAGSAAEDPEVQLDLAEVARLAGDRATETQACANALRLDPQRFAATVCTVRTALDTADFTRATQLLEQARSAGAPEPQLSRLRAELAVASGHGALDVEAVQTFLRTHRNDVPLLVSLARLQLQAEDGNDADDTARRVLSLSPENPEALYVRAYVAYVDGHFGTADELLDRAHEGARTVSLRARVAALRGMLAYEDRRYGNPQALVDEAIAADGRCATAHLLRALIASRDPSAQRTALEAAAQGTDTPAEAIARLAMALGSNAQGCALAERYVRMAPDGYDRRDVDDVRGGCR
jgi:tetratricopeptide (TPR) repeat protein